MKKSTETLVNDYLAELIHFHAAERVGIPTVDDHAHGWTYWKVDAPLPDAETLAGMQADLATGDQDADLQAERAAQVEFLEQQAGAIIAFDSRGYPWVRTYEAAEEFEAEWRRTESGEIDYDEVESTPLPPMPTPSRQEPTPREGGDSERMAWALSHGWSASEIPAQGVWQWMRHGEFAEDTAIYVIRSDGSDLPPLTAAVREHIDRDRRRASDAGR